MKRGLKYDFTLMALVLVPVGVSISVVGYQMSTILKLPIFVDQIGTILVSMIAGPKIHGTSGRDHGSSDSTEQDCDYNHT